MKSKIGIIRIWYDNPYFEAYEKIKSINNFTTNGSLSFKYEILPWLKLQLRAEESLMRIIM